MSSGVTTPRSRRLHKVVVARYAVDLQRVLRRRVYSSWLPGTQITFSNRADSRRRTSAMSSTRSATSPATISQSPGSRGGCGRRYARCPGGPRRSLIAQSVAIHRQSCHGARGHPAPSVSSASCAGRSGQHLFSPLRTPSGVVTQRPCTTPQRGRGGIPDRRGDGSAVGRNRWE